MSSKEFKLRLKYWKIWAPCLKLFQNNLSLNNIYKVTVLFSSYVRRDFYTDLLDLSELMCFNCESILISRYTLVQFKIDLIHFKSFYSSLSKTQKLVFDNIPEFKFFVELNK